jgi:hypothetical protein
MPDFRGKEGGTAVALVRVDNAYRLAGMDLAISYDPDVLEFLSGGLKKTYMTKDFTCAANAQDGVIMISAVSAATPVEGYGSVFWLEFDTVGATGGGCELSFVEDQVKLYDFLGNALPVECTDKAVFTVSPYYNLGDCTGDGAIGAADALKIMRVSLGFETMSTEAMNAADMNGDGIITAADLVLLLRYAVGLPVVFNEDVSAVMQGARTGLQADVYELSMPTAIALTGEEFDMALSINDAVGVAGGEFQLNYDPDYLTLVTVAPSSSTTDFECSYNALENGVVKFTLARETALSAGETPLAELRFRVNGDEPHNTVLALADAQICGEYGQDLSWDSTVTTVNGSVYIANKGLNLYVSPVRAEHRETFDLKYLNVPVKDVNFRGDVALGIGGAGGIYVVNRGMRSISRYESLAGADRIARNIDFGRRFQGNLLIPIPAHTCINDLRFIAAVLHGNRAVQISRSNEVGIR